MKCRVKKNKRKVVLFEKEKREILKKETSCFEEKSFDNRRKIMTN